MSNHTKTQVGTLTLTKPTETTQHYECAAWYQTIRVAPGVYPVVAYLGWLDYHERTAGHTFYAEVSGPIVAASFQSRLGAHYGKDDGPSLVGKTAEGSITFGTFAVIGREPVGLALDPTILERVEWTPDGDTGPMVRWRLRQEWIDGLEAERTAKRALAVRP